MNTSPSIPVVYDAQQVLAAAVAHRVEHMSQDELQALIAKAHGELKHENSTLHERIKDLEEEKAALESQNERLLYKLSRSLFDEKDYEGFDPSEYTVPWEEMLADARQRLRKE